MSGRDTSSQVNHLEDEEEYWDLSTDQRDDILHAIDLLEDQLNTDAPPNLAPAEVSPNEGAEEEN